MHYCVDPKRKHLNVVVMCLKIKEILKISSLNSVVTHNL